jgi:multiple sugar transport system ATP-binding protein
LSNLDAQLRNEMRTEIKRLHQRLGATIIYVTHDQTEAMTLADRICVLQGGHKMQYDTPEAVYNRPAALFVAGFTGAPAMNLVPCRVDDGYAAVGPARLALPFALASFTGDRTLGVRPENLTLAAQSEIDIAVPSTLSLLEPLGSETLITLRIGEVDLMARVSAGFKERVGSTLTIHVNPNQLHLFDRKSGQALGR